MKKWIPEIVCILGGCLTALGIGIIYLPGGIIVSGILLTTWGIGLSLIKANETHA